VSEPSDVLIVDDDKQLAFGVSCRLQAGGYSTRIAESGEQGLAAAAAHRPDVILMDVMMPGIDGITAMRQLRADPYTHDVPVIMLSASLGDERNALDAGARFFLKKPYSHDRLFAAIERVVAPRPTAPQSARWRADPAEQK
jgi:CheY-like chemotaxis protein